jgi:hypothetical protein
VITRLDIISDLIASLEHGDLTQEQLLLYLEDNTHILKSNVEQALLQHKKETVEAVLEENLDRYAAAQETILANYRAFSLAADRATDRVMSAYGHDIPDIVLVPCIGLFSNGGWKEQVDDKSYICVALERLSPTVHLDILSPRGRPRGRRNQVGYRPGWVLRRRTRHVRLPGALSGPPRGSVLFHGRRMAFKLPGLDQEQQGPDRPGCIPTVAGAQSPSQVLLYDRLQSRLPQHRLRDRVPVPETPPPGIHT